MKRLEELLLLILDRAKKEGKNDLSKFQLYKIPFLLQVYSIKYAGTPLITDATFIRDKNGPISIDIATALENLKSNGYINMEVIENPEYGYAKHSFTLTKKVPKTSFNEGEIIFLDNFLSELLPLTQAKLKEIAYATEPMQEIQIAERGKGVLKGKVINFSTVAVDSDVVDMYSNTQ